jgi:membrane fusion protein (multidrug efflux system)
MTLVPLESAYIEGNFRETQIDHVRPGQRVTIFVDALPGVALSGHVQNLEPASGVFFSLLPAHNATGNFTKIVQRLPVRISIDPDQSAARDLRVGMSVIPAIDVSAGKPP